MRMRPDRIIIGEVRGAEAFDLLQAMNTGHEGSIASLHASGVRDALNKLETMVLMDGLEIPIPALKEYICNAVDIIVFISRMKDGKRKITNISELNGVNDGVWDLKDATAVKLAILNSDVNSVYDVNGDGVVNLADYTATVLKVMAQ